MQPALQLFRRIKGAGAGPGKTLCGFNKRMDRSLKNLNVENIASLEKTLDYFKEVR